MTVFAAGGFVNVENHGGRSAEAILETIADAMANCGCISIGQVPSFCHQSTQKLSPTATSANPPCEILFEHASRNEETLRRIGKFSAREYALQERQACHRGLSADDILLVAAVTPAAFVLHSIMEPLPRLYDAKRSHWRLHRLLIKLRRSKES